MKFIGRLLLVFAGILIVLIIGAVILVSLSKGTVPERAVLEIDLETGLIEDVPDDPVARAVLRQPNVRDIVDALEKAGDDSRVAGLIARLGAARMGLGQIQEVRDAVIRFRSKKKFAVAYSETFGEFGNGAGAYYLATSFDQIYMQPSGDVGLTGMLIETPFVRGTLEKLGLRFRGDQRYEYKNAFNFFTERKYTPPHREAMQRLLDSWFAQMVRGIAEARRIPEKEVRALIDRGPFLGEEALKTKLVDKLAYRDEVYDEVKKRAGQDAELIYAHKYLERAGRPHESGKTIALIYAVGGVSRGKSGYDPVFDDVRMGSETVGAALRAATEEKDVKAIILRVDSPGGSYVASDTIWHETLRAKKAGKPVIITMGNLAASGGYFVAMAADKIVAQPGTITGSIGVLGGKMLTSGFWDKLGLSFDDVRAGANAAMWTGRKDYSPAEWSRFQASLDRIYGDFTSKVAEGRKLPKNRVLEIAKGRIWTGEDAKAIGLVDELGGFPVALGLAKKAANIPEKEGVEIRVFPRRKSTWDLLTGKEADNSEEEGASIALIQILRTIQPLAQRLRAIAGDPPEVLALPVEVPRQP